MYFERRTPELSFLRSRSHLLRNSLWEKVACKYAWGEVAVSDEHVHERNFLEDFAFAEFAP